MNMAYNVVQELLCGKEDDEPISQYYADFKMTFEELRVLFPISTD